MSLEPYPDYWSSLLWKRLMGRRVLDAGLSADLPGEGATAGLLRIYAHCAGGEAARPGAVTVSAINLDRSRSVRLAFEGVGDVRELYRLTGPDPLGTEVRLDDTALVLADDGSPPSLTAVATHDPVELPPLSYAFVVLPEAGAAPCR